MTFLSNIYDPKKPEARMNVAMSFEDWSDPQGPDRAWQRHLDWLKSKVIGRPQGTEAYTVEQLEEMGYVGVYLPD